MFNNDVSQDLLIDNGFENKLEINLDIDRIFQDSYFIIVPIVHEEEEFWIDFYPNGFVSLFHIPFTNGWRFFIEIILDKTGYYFGGRGGFIKRMEEIRELYLPIFKKLQCDKIFLTTDFQSNWENELVFGDTKNNYTFDDILSAAKEKDAINVFNLEKVFAGEHDTEIKKLNDANDYYKIAFLDDIY